MHVRVEKSRVRNMKDVVEELETMKHRTFRFYCKHSTGIGSEFVVPILELRIKHS